MNNKSDLFCTFYLVRHGETDLNAKGVIQGQYDSVLTERGIQQAMELAKELKHYSFDAVLTSDLTRARHTAEIIALEHKLVVQTAELLRERKWGILEGKPREKLREFNKIYSSLNEDEKFRHKVVEDMESDEEIANRFITFVREVCINMMSKKVLIVAHKGIIRSFLIKIGFWTYADIQEIPNASYIVFKSDGVNFFVESLRGFESKIPQELKHEDK